MMKTKFVAGFGVALLLLAGCVPFKRLGSRYVGRDGWETKGPVLNKQINAFRGIDQSVWILPVEHDPRKFYVKITPPDLALGVPSWANHDATSASGFQGLWYQYRYYRIPDGKTFVDVYDWYIQWFDFKAKP